MRIPGQFVLASAMACAIGASAAAGVPDKGAHELYLSAGGLAGGALTGAVRYGHFVARGLEIGAGLEGGLIRRSSWFSAGPFAEKIFDLGGPLAPFIGAQFVYGTSVVELRADPDNPAAEPPGGPAPLRRSRGFLAGASAGANYFIAPNAALSGALQADVPGDERLRFAAPGRARLRYVLATRFYF